ncbi:hypothetical protein CspeluHIS016_0209820 [Cutaneotrichosporon spelunceum]|uniref:Protein kinase domain-containing protein n=1 Tax=Cutaneotrichosporon spelunceum TaxID=1672016 RepID=A0AAD3YAG0_9TREE|nr:hypothetical protein CspeluHIS016_0209820 [Cutaneotrichosporon spelunceum]
MSAPLTQLQNKLSHVSLGKTRPTPPLVDETSPEARTRTPASSCPLSVDTPPPVTTPQHLLGRMVRRNTPTPLTAIYDLGCSNTTPTTSNNALLGLGSPFLAKSALRRDDLESPTLGPPRHQSDWGATDAVPDLQVSGGCSHGSLSNAEDTGSCTSASSFFSSERHAPQSSRPSVVNVWEDGNGEEDATLQVKRPLLSAAARPNDQFWQTRLFQSSPGPTSPLLGKSLAPSPTGSGPLSPFLPWPLSRVDSASSTSAIENEPIDSPIRSGTVTASSRRSGRRRLGMGQHGDDHLPIVSAESLPRRTSDPSHPTDPSAFSFAQYTASRGTQSEMAHHYSTSSPPSSEPSEIDSTPSRSDALKRSTTALPPRPVHQTMRPRTSELPFTGLPEGTMNWTLPRRADPFQSARPRLPKTVTMPEMSTSVGTPVARLPLFGDDKPSPAAFQSSGINKKRGEKHRPRASLPMAKHTPRWSPLPKAAAPRTSEQRPVRSFLASSLANAVGRSQCDVRGGDSDTREELSQEYELEDTDQEDMSPLRPMRSSLHRPIGSQHRRVSSTASDMMTSPVSKRKGGHARMSSTASIGGSRGLRRKGSCLFGSGASDGEMPAPATPTKSGPWAPLQPKFGMTTPSPTPASTRYPFARRLSMASVTSVDTSPTATPLAAANARTLSGSGPLVCASNPMLGGTYRAHGGMPATPVGESQIGDTYIPRAAREAGVGRYDRDFATIQALGQGEFSSVWKVRSKVDDTLWAVKKGKPYSGNRDRQRQLEEVAILRAVGQGQHPNIIRLADSWEEAGRLHISTELAPCGDLAHFLLSVSEFGGLEEGRVWKMLAELTSALYHIHSHGVLHLDFKPSNILITTEGILKVADFGLSVFAIAPLAANDLSRGKLGVTNSESERSLGPSPVVDHEGDREYLCPEALNDVPPAPPADVYSLGIMTLEAALSVELPSNGEAWIKLRHDDFSDLEDQYAIRDGPKPEVVPGLPPTPVVSAELINTIVRMMASNPERRMTLAEALVVAPLQRAREAMERGREEGGLLRGRIAGPALAEEGGGWTAYVLGEEV